MSGEDYLQFLDEYWELFEDLSAREILEIKDAKL